MVPQKADHDNLTGSVPRAPGCLLDTLPKVVVTPHALRATRQAWLELCRVLLCAAMVGANVGDIDDDGRGMTLLR
jgi:hypothetical protein